MNVCERVDIDAAILINGLRDNTLEHVSNYIWKLYQTKWILKRGNATTYVPQINIYIYCIFSINQL